MQSYDHNRIEQKWKRVWKQTGLYSQRLSGKAKKCYTLDMFPYPSGEGLHVGHPKGYIATDIYSRMKRMQGYSILHPMGWDAFGLPAENYAIKNKVHPAVAVKKNIKRFKKQLGLLGFNYEWEREINTTDPAYYAWTQWMFLQMFHKGLAFLSTEPINWCPSCKTGLANEDLEDGKCERCGSIVEKKSLPQWVLRITDYADRLLSGLDSLDWPEHIKESQRNWIGRSEGAVIEFEVKSAKCNVEEKIKVFTTRADTLFGATYLVLAPEHPMLRTIEHQILNIEEVRKYQNEASKRTEIERTAEGKEKTGLELQGIVAVNPASKEEIPVWIADYVLRDYGTGAIMAVPAHDERDFQFAKKFSLPIREVVSGGSGLKASLADGPLVNSGTFDGLSGNEARKAICASVGGKLVTKYKLRDWVFSRQRYWGEPIPLVFCENCKKQVENSKFQVSISKQNPKKSKIEFTKGELMNPGWVGVPQNKLPVKLPKVKSYEPTGTGESPLAAIESFVETTCPKCGGPARRETNTMPQWAGSCWYYLAYIVKRISQTAGQRGRADATRYTLRDKRALARWLPVDMYVGGAEHATRHLIYARFWHKFLFDIGVVETEEPFQRLQNVGLILASDGRKMSKRFGNVVNPDEIVERFGADSLRVYEMFMGPFNQAIAWNTDSLVGSRRFLERAFKLRRKVTKKNDSIQSSEVLALLHQTIKKVGDDILTFRFNTAISALMILLNALEKEEVITLAVFKTFLVLLAPFAPHLSEELWAQLAYKKSIHLEQWPSHDEVIATDVPITISVQINGKVRETFTARRNEPEEKLRETALALPEVQKWTVGKEIRKVIVVPNRIVSIVVV